VESSSKSDHTLNSSIIRKVEKSVIRMKRVMVNGKLKFKAVPVVVTEYVTLTQPTPQPIKEVSK
jgi:hypothetical protein